MFSVTTRHRSGTTGLAVAGPRRAAKSSKGLRAVFLAIGIGPIAAAAVWSGATAAQLAATSATPAVAVSADSGKSSGDDNVPFGMTVLRGSSTAGNAAATAGPDKHSSGNSDPFGVTVLRGAPSPPTAPYPCSSGDGIDRGLGCVPPAEPYSPEQPSEDLGYWPYDGYGWPYFGSAALSHRAFRHRFAHRRSIVAPRSAFRHPNFRFARGSGGFGRHGHR